MISRLWHVYFVSGIRRAKWFSVSIGGFLLYAAVNVGVLGRQEAQVTLEAVVVMACLMVFPAFVDATEAAASRSNTLSSEGPAIDDSRDAADSTQRQESKSRAVPRSVNTDAIESIIYCDAPVASPMQRGLASLIDGVLILLAGGLFFGTATALGFRGISTFGTLRLVVCAMVLLAFLYKVLWILASGSTPGMRYLHLELVDFDGRTPGRSQRAIRLLAGCLSILSAGLGLIWALVDEEGLTWHDHITRTFPSPARLRLRMPSSERTRVDLQVDLFGATPRSRLSERQTVGIQFELPVEDPDQLSLFSPHVVSIDTVRRSARARFLGARRKQVRFR